MAEHQCMLLVTKNGKRTLAHSGKRGEMNRIYKHLKSEANPENIDCVERWDMIGGLSGKHDHSKKGRKVINMAGGITQEIQLERVNAQLAEFEIELKALNAANNKSAAGRAALRDLMEKINPLRREAKSLEDRIQQLEDQLS